MADTPRPPRAVDFMPWRSLDFESNAVRYLGGYKGLRESPMGDDAFYEDVLLELCHRKDVVAIVLYQDGNQGGTYWRVFAYFNEGAGAPPVRYNEVIGWPKDEDEPLPPLIQWGTLFVDTGSPIRFGRRSYSVTCPRRRGADSYIAVLEALHETRAAQ